MPENSCRSSPKIPNLDEGIHNYSAMKVIVFNKGIFTLSNHVPTFTDSMSEIHFWGEDRLLKVKHNVLLNFTSKST